MKICGIYIIKNDINNLCYIGQSVDIYCRWYAHKQAVKNINDQSANTKIHKAMRELGIEHFFISILEECDYTRLNEREQFWINYYDSYKNGYNMTLGGDSNIGENNGRSILTRSQVEDIRMAYASHVPFRVVLEKYKNIISKRGLQKVWHNETWKYIMPEVYTKENIEWHRTLSKSLQQPKLNNQQKQIDEETYNLIKKLYNDGLTYNKIAKIVGCSASTVRKYCLTEYQPTKMPGNPIRNIETNMVFSSFTQAAKWAQCDRHTISNNIKNNLPAGIVPTTNQPAHWVLL